MSPIAAPDQPTAASADQIYATPAASTELSSPNDRAGAIAILADFGHLSTGGKSGSGECCSLL